MSGLTNSINHRHKISITIILVLVVMLIQPLFIPTLGENTNSTRFDRFVPSAENPSLNLTYFVSTNLTEVPVVSNSVIAGDHLTLKAAWTPSIVSRSRLEVVAPAIPATLIQDLNTHTIEIDTRYLGNNGTCAINATAWLTNGTVISRIFVNVYIGNFFVPRVKVLSPNGAEVWSGINNITWTSSDANVGDSLHFQVLISSNGGKSFDSLASSITRKWFAWDCSTLDRLDTYLVEVRVTDGIYFSSDRSDSTFTAGEIINTTTPTTTATTTNTTEPTTTTFDPRLAAFMVILVVSSSVMAIVVYYAARKWF